MTERLVKRRWLSLLILAGLMPLLTACLGTMNMLSRPDVNLTAASYAAADMLLQQARPHLSQQTVLALGSLSDLEASGSAPLGKVIAGQVGARFVQLGYQVHMPDDIGTVSAGTMPASPATPVMKAPLPGASGGKGVSVGNVQAMITGHYVRSNDQVLVNLRIVDMGSGRIWGAYDYAMPLTNEIARLMASPEKETEKQGLFDF